MTGTVRPTLEPTQHGWATPRDTDSAPRWRLSRDLRGYRDGAATIISVEGAGERGIHSAGVDLADVDRFQRAVDRSDGRLLRRVFDDSELDSAATAVADRGALFTGLFSMKESVVKVLGGLPPGGRYRDISLGDTTADAEPETSVHPVRMSGVLGQWADSRVVEVIAGNFVFANGLVLSWALALTDAVLTEGDTP